MSANGYPTHALDQYIAFRTEVWGRMKGLKDDLMLDGWRDDEAWYLVRELERDLISPIHNYFLASVGLLPLTSESAGE